MKTEKSGAALSVDALENVADLYIRVSTTEQAEEGYSVGEQEARGRAYCAAYGLIINAVHVDAGYSGATLDRPGIKNVIKDICSGNCKKVVVWKLDRLSRSQKDTLILLEDVLLENGCGFVSIMESFDTSTPFGRCIVGILAAFAQMERENIRARLMMGKQAGLKEGNYYSGVTPIGYKAELQDNGKRALVADPFSSQAVKDMYRLYGSGKSLGEIATFVQKKYGLYADRDRRSAADRCGKILRNPVYAGRVIMGDLEYTGKHEPLVNAEIWQQVNDRLAKNKKAYQRMYSGSDGLLSGLLFCGDCGARMSIRQWGFGEGKVNKYICYSVSRCSKKMIRSDSCSNRKNHFAIGDLDALVLEEIKKLSLDPVALDSLIEENQQEAGPDLESFAERLADVEKQITRLLNLYQTGVVELEEVQGRLADLKNERRKLQESLDELEAQGSRKMSKGAAVAALNSLNSVISSGDPEALYSLVHNLIEKVVVYNGDVTIHWAFC